jgi:sulfate transport system ATP-binding protein
LKLIQLPAFARSRPAELSGGQRQRVALARALAAEPRVLLLDEPFGALDAKVRQELREWLRSLHDQLHVTTVLVTHDQDEAFEVADRVAIMNAGQVEQLGTPAEIFQQPASPFVMNFLGEVNVFHGHVQGGRVRLRGLDMPYPPHPHEQRKPASAFVRAHDLDVVRAENGRPSLRAVVVQVNTAGPVAKVRLVSEDFGVELSVHLERDQQAALALTVGERVWVVPRRVRVFVHQYRI